MKPDQCTLVPVMPGEITSQAGWPRRHAARRRSPASIARLKAAGVRVSLFVDPEPAAIRWARDLGADRVELYTEPFARAFERGPAAAAASFENYADAARLAHELGLGVNAGHDLDLRNLTLFKTLPHLDEVSIGHALISRAMFVGLRHGGAGIPRGRRGRRHEAPGVACAAPWRAAGRRVSALPRRRGRRTPGACNCAPPTARRSPATLVRIVRVARRRPSCWCTCSRRIARTTGAAFADRLQAAGIDRRWPSICAATAGRAVRRRRLPPMVQDVRPRSRGWRRAPDVASGAIGLVGASLGASLAALAAADLA